MAGLQVTEAAKARHGALVDRVAAIAASLFGGSDILLRDADEDGAPLAPRMRVVSLSRGDKPAIRCETPQHVRVTYRDAAGETALAQVVAAMARGDDPLAADPQSLSIFALADRLAGSDIPVLINGPTGTGKEVLSRFLHARSERAAGPFVAVNCAALPEAMLEALLFGHRKGAFTGATEASEGFLRAADGGTLLLDEIAEMPLPLQAKLLRALQEGEVVPLGATAPVKIDVRVIACANRDLPTEVAEGRFRADLYYRLNVFPLTTRALHARPEDIAPLTLAFVLRHAADTKAPPMVDEDALALLKGHAWPGNVRELENVVRRALVLAQGSETIRAEHIVFDQAVRLVEETPVAMPQPEAGPRKLSSAVRDTEARAICDALEASGGNRVKAARALGISERTLRYRLASLRDAGIEVGRMAAGGQR
ncbi:MAG: sigma 54-interacting transcriptional regulator [Sphingomonadaceae bacterium]|jgi:two-component system response regulator FlrC